MIWDLWFGIGASRLGFGPWGWDIGLESEICASRLGGGGGGGKGRWLLMLFQSCCKINPADEMSLTALVLWTKVQSCFKGWLGISQVDRATFHFGLNYLLSKRNTSLPMPDPVQWKGPSSVSEASAAVVAQEAREGFISEWWMRLLKIVNEVLVILHKSRSFTFLPSLHFILFLTCYWGLGDLAQKALSY